MMIRVKQVVRFGAHGCAQEIPIQGHDIRVLMGEADGLRPIQGPQYAAAALSHLNAVVNRLTAAAGAAAGASHNLYKVIGHIALLQGPHKLAGIAQAADHRNANGTGAGNLEYSLLPAVHTADSVERIGVRIAPVTMR